MPNDQAPRGDPSSGWPALARCRGLRRPLRGRWLRRRRHPRPSFEWPGRLPGAGAGGQGDAADPVVPGDLESGGSPPAGSGLARPQPGGDRAGAHVSHRRPRLHFDAQHRAAARRAGVHAGRCARPPSAARRGGGRVRSDGDAPQEPQRQADPGISAGSRPPHDRTRRRGGRRCISHGRPASGCRPVRVASPRGRGKPGGTLPGRLPGGVRGHAWPWTRCRDRRALGAELVRTGPALPCLSECVESALARRSRLRD